MCGNDMKRGVEQGDRCFVSNPVQNYIGMWQDWRGLLYTAHTDCGICRWHSNNNKIEQAFKM